MLADQIPIIQEELYLSEKIFSGFDASRLENGSLFETLMQDLKLNEPPVGVSKIEAVNASMELGQVLKINTGDAVLKMTTYWSDTEEIHCILVMENIVVIDIVLQFNKKNYKKKICDTTASVVSQIFYIRKVLS